MSQKSHTLRVFFSMAIMMIAPALVYAAQIVVGFTATVQSVDDASCQCLGFEAGEPLTGYFSFNSNALDALPDVPEEGQYHYDTPPNGMAVWVAQHEFRSDSANVAFSVYMLNDFSELDYDKIVSYEENPIHPQGPAVDWMRLDLRDDTHTLLENDSLPLEIPAIEEWTSGELVIMGQDFSIQASIQYMFEGYPAAAQEFSCSVPPILDLLPASPNPFSNRTTIHIFLHTVTDVSIDVFDVAGRRVYSDHMNDMSTGSHRIPIQLQSGHSGHLPGGVYLYRVRAGGETHTSKLVSLQ